MTEVKTRVALVCASTDDGRPLTGVKNLVWTVVEGHRLQVTCIEALIDSRTLKIRCALVARTEIQQTQEQ